MLVATTARRHALTTLLLCGLTAVRLASPLLVTPLLAHRLDSGELGTWSICLSLATTAAVFVELGFGLSATRAAADPDAMGARAVFDAVCSTRMASAVLLMPAVALAVAWQLGGMGSAAAGIASVVWLTALSMGASSLWYFQHQRRLVLYSAIDTLGLCVGVLLIATFAHGLRSALLANLVTYAAPSLIGHAWVVRGLGPARLSLAGARAGWRMTRALARFRFVAAAYTSAIPFLLSLSLAPTRIAPFYVAERLVRSVAALLSPIVQLLYPRMCLLRHEDPAGHRRSALRLAGWLAGGAAVVAASMALAATRLARLFAPPDIAPAVASHLRELSVYLVPLAVSSVLGNLYMLPGGQDRAFNRIILAAAVTGVTLAFVLPRTALSASGASAAVVASETVAALLMVLRFVRPPELGSKH